MQLLSTRSDVAASPFEAVLMGLAPDGGLFVPEYFPSIDANRIKEYARMPFEQISGDILSEFFEIDKPELMRMCLRAYSRFDNSDVVPLRYLGSGLYCMELYHGPTLAFKDVALQLLPLLMAHSAKAVGQKEKSLILVATSGDTGKAALEGFADKEDTAIIVFYPKEGVSHAQLLQMTTQTGSNVHVVAVEGDFDACQNGIKELMNSKAFANSIAQLGFKLSSGNSINFGRLAPQIVYYFSSYAQLLRTSEIKPGEEVDFIVPTGNFGNILAGYYAKRMGLPIGTLVCASNANNVLARFFNSGIYDGSGKLTKTTSPSMDILVSSNLERLLYEASGRDHTIVSDWMAQLSKDRYYEVGQEVMEVIGNDLYGGWSTDEEAEEAIREAFTKRDFLMDPHSAIGLSVYRKYRQADRKHSNKSILACTASPYKFSGDVLAALTNKKITNVEDGRLPDYLERQSEEPQPRAIAELNDLPILHSAECTPQGMEKESLDWLKTQ